MNGTYENQFKLKPVLLGVSGVLIKHKKKQMQLKLFTNVKERKNQREWVERNIKDRRTREFI